jgi:hypothetical protein
MTVRLYEWDKTETGWAWIEITDNKVVNLLLRSLNNLIKINDDNEAYVDLQLEDWIEDDANMPVWVNVGRVLQADWWLATGTLLVAKTTSGDEIRFLFADNWKLYTDNWTWTFTQIYLKPEVDALFQQLRSELSTVAFTGDYDDLLNKPTLWTAAALDAGNLAWNVPVLDSNWKLDSSIVPSTWVMTTYTVTNKSDLTTLTSAKKWDIGIVTSENKTYILSNDPYSTLSNWTELLFPTWSVSSINWLTWAVNLTTGYIQESGDNLFVSSTEKATWNNKLWADNVSTVALTGNYGDLNNKPVIDSTLNTASTNAIQNWAVATAVNSINSDITSIQWDIISIGTDKQDTLVSGTNIKTVNSTSLLWSWDVAVQETLVSGTNIKTINNESILWSGNIEIQWWNTYNAWPWIIIWDYSDYSAMRWPCPEWYHIPLKDEWNDLLWILTNTFSLTWNEAMVGTYLKMPKAGFRDATTSSSLSLDYAWGYWSATSSGSFAYTFSFYPGTFVVGLGYQKYAHSIRQFKDSPVIPDSTWTTLYDWSSVAIWAWIFYNATLWLISISWDWTNWITITDKNLWATVVYNSWDTLSEANCGYLYQWGNNYWFSYNWDVATSSTSVDASDYGPWNYYSSSTFIKGSWAWSNPVNWNLRWWVTWIVTTQNAIYVDMNYIRNHIN